MNSLFQPSNLKGVSGLAVGLSLRLPEMPGEFSMRPTNSTKDIVQANRRNFAEQLGYDLDHLAVVNQDHTGEVDEVIDMYNDVSAPKADALITHTPGLLLGVTIADCVGILFYDPIKQVIGVTHSGRKGTIYKIAITTINKMKDSYSTNPGDLLAYVSPCPNATEYPIDLETAKSCDPRYISPTTNLKEVYYDNRQAVYDQLMEAGLRPEHIEVDPRSTVSDPQLHSYRRDHEKSGRMLLAIGLH